MTVEEMLEEISGKLTDARSCFTISGFDDTGPTPCLAVYFLSTTTGSLVRDYKNLDGSDYTLQGSFKSHEEASYEFLETISQRISDIANALASAGSDEIRVNVIP